MRKAIGWALFVLGFPIIFVGIVVSRELSGTIVWGILVGIAVITGGWFLAHPKKGEN
jgi:hypothetical protein